MPFVDDRGRVFGRLNIIDAAVLVAVCLLVPLTYGAYLLFRPPLPRLTAVEPTRVPPGTTRVSLRGEHLRPNLRVAIGDIGTRLLLADAENAVVEFAPLAPGSYDVRLLDGGQPVSTLSKALTVPEPSVPAPTPRAIPPTPVLTQSHLVAIGTFNGLSSEAARSAWQALASLGESGSRLWNVVGVESPEPNVTFIHPQGLPVSDERYQVPAVLRFRCVLVEQNCTAFGVVLQPDAAIPLPLAGAETVAVFRVSEIHPVYTDVLQLTLRSALAVGELEAAREQISAKSRPTIRSPFHPTLESLEVVEPAGRDFVAELAVRVPVINTAAGWMHRDRLLRIADGFAVTGRGLVVSGRIVAIAPSSPFKGR